MSEKISDPNDGSESDTAKTPIFKYVLKGNREVVTDFYVPNDISGQPTNFRYKVFIRLNAIEKTFKNVSFLHCIFDNCYLKECVFDTCDFTGCKFLGSNFHQTSFRGCTFDFAIFERSQFDDDILMSEAPKEENLSMMWSDFCRHSNLGRFMQLSA
jgi:uncharacterized protein YjbI with pentapeptide repeats